MNIAYLNIVAFRMVVRLYAYVLFLKHTLMHARARAHTHICFLTFVGKTFLLLFKISLMYYLIRIGFII